MKKDKGNPDLGRANDGRYIGSKGKDLTCQICCNHRSVMQDTKVKGRLICLRCHNAKEDKHVREGWQQTADGDREIARIEALQDSSTLEYEKAAEMRHYMEENKMTPEEYADSKTYEPQKGTSSAPKICFPEGGRRFPQKGKKSSPFEPDCDSDNSPLAQYYVAEATPEELDPPEDLHEVVKELKEEIEKLKKDKGI